MKTEYEFDRWEVQDVHFNGNRLPIDQAAACLALQDAGFFDETESWQKYESSLDVGSVDMAFTDYFKPESEMYWGDEICGEYHEKYSDVSKTSGNPFTREAAEKLPINTPLTFYPDEGTWECSNSNYVRIAKYYRFTIKIKVC